MVDVKFIKDRLVVAKSQNFHLEKWKIGKCQFFFFLTGKKNR